MGPHALRAALAGLNAGLGQGEEKGAKITASCPIGDPSEMVPSFGICCINHCPPPSCLGLQLPPCCSQMALETFVISSVSDQIV